MTRGRRRRSWRLWLPFVALLLLALPFFIHRTTGYYTDGESVHEPERKVELSIRKVLWEPPTPLRPEIASPESREYEPRVDPFGEALVFTRGLPGGEADLWLSERQRGRWSSPLPVDGVNTDHDELGGAFSSDGSWLYFYSDRPGGFGGYDIWASERLAKGWGEPVNLGPAINSSWNEMSPAPGPRGVRLYFTTDRRPGEKRSPRWQSTIRAHLRSADYDIYLASLDSHRQPGAEPRVESPDGVDPETPPPETGLPETGLPETGLPETGLPVSPPPVAVRYANATPVVALNLSGSAEGAVAVSPVGDFLYFASNRAGGEGGFDLYRVRLDDGVAGEVETLGSQVNTSADELDPALAPGGYELYFSRVRDGQEDLLVSASKEVYLTREDEGPYWTIGAFFDGLEDLIRRAPPWLLGLLISLLVCAALLLFFRRWVLSPSVVMRCFVIALLVHLILAFWMKRNYVQRLLLEIVEIDESYEPFQVAVEGMPEESIGFSIREASAATQTDTSPTLVARLEVRRLPPRPLRRERSPISEPLSERPEPTVLPLVDPQSRPEVETQDDTENPEASPEVPQAVEDDTAPEVEARLVEAEPEAEAQRDTLDAERRSRAPRSVEADSVEVTLPREIPRPPTLDDPDVERTQDPGRADAKVAAETVDPSPSDPSVAPKETPATSVEITRRAVEPAPESPDGTERSESLALVHGQSRDRREPIVEVSSETVDLALKKSSAAAQSVDRDEERAPPNAARAVSGDKVASEVETPRTPSKVDDGSPAFDVAPRRSDPAAVESARAPRDNQLAIERGRPAPNEPKTSPATVPAVESVVKTQRDVPSLSDERAVAARSAPDGRRLSVAQVDDVSPRVPTAPTRESSGATAPEVASRTTEVAPESENTSSARSPSLAVSRDPSARRTPRSSKLSSASSASSVDPVRSRTSDADDDARPARALPEVRGASLTPATDSGAATQVTTPAREDAASTAPAIASRELEEAETTETTKSASTKIESVAKRSTRRSPRLTRPRRGVGIEISRRSTRRLPSVDLESTGDRSKDLASKIGRAGSVVDDTAAVMAAEVARDATASSFRPRIYQLRSKDRRGDALIAGGGSEATERAVVAGLEWLSIHQAPDGRWTLDRFHRYLDDVSDRDRMHPGWNGKGRKSSIGGRGKAANGDTAATGLALLAFLGHGDSHVEEGPFREQIDKGVRWLVKSQKPDGDLRGGGNMYMHGVAAFALTEAYAFTRDPNLREPAQRAIDFTASSQVPNKGGWRYEPYPKSKEVDTSVFGWMLMALKSGKLGGLQLPEECLTRAHAYIESARKRGEFGLYVYEPGKGTKKTDLAMTAQGFFAQHILADTVLTEEQRGSSHFRRSNLESTKYLLKNRPQAKDMKGVNFYYWYYATLAMFQSGGEPWEFWNESLKKVLLEHQVGSESGSAAGSWDPRGHRAELAGRLYSTALSILCLEVYYRYERLQKR